MGGEEAPPHWRLLSLVLSSGLVLLTYAPLPGTLLRTWFSGPQPAGSSAVCGTEVHPTFAGPRWHAPAAPHAIIFTGRFSDFDFARMDTVVQHFGGSNSTDLYAAINCLDAQESDAEDVLFQFSSLPNAVAAELVREPPAGQAPPAALAVLPSFPYGLMDGPFVSSRTMALIFYSWQVAWQLLACSEGAAGRRRRYAMVVRARSDLRISEGQQAVSLDAFADGRHGLEERLEGLHALEGIGHGDNLRTALLPSAANPPDLGYSALRALPLFLPNRYNFLSYNDQLGWGTRECMQDYFNTLQALEETCGPENDITFGPEAALKGALILQAAKRGAVIAVHYVNIDYCINSGTNPCEGDVDLRCNEECVRAAADLKTVLAVQGLP